MRKGVLLGIALLIGGCARPPASPPVSPAMEFGNAIEAARQRVDSGDYPAADRILAEYALKHPGTAEAREIPFWRAMYIVDPQNRTASIAQGIRALDLYLASDGTIWYRPQAEVLRRTALVIQSIRQAQAPRQVNGRDTVFITREEEIAALRDQLAKANAELERIKKRLANPGR